MRMMDARLIDGVTSLLIKADEQAYWERPHEVRLDLPGAHENSGPAAKDATK